MIKLKIGETATDKFGNTHGNFIAVIENYTELPEQEKIDIVVNVYSSLEAYNNKYASSHSKVYSVNEEQYGTISTAIKNNIHTNNIKLIDALYNLLMTRDAWADWEIAWIKR